jgi:hypothetical protein
VRVEQRAAEFAPGLVQALKRVECLPVFAQHSLDFDIVCDGRKILGTGRDLNCPSERKGDFHLATQEKLAPVFSFK